MRVNVQLIDAESGSHLWAERFDKPLADLFDMAPPTDYGFEPQSQGFERPSVVIDQLDVLIHEPAPAKSATTAMQARSRAVRARHLRRL